MIMLIFVSFQKGAMGDPRTTFVGQFCNTTTAVSGAILADNFVPAMDNLSTLVNANGFGTTVVGKGPNAVFALGQCLEDLDSIDCMLCFSEIRSQLPKCYPNRGGRIYLDGCFGRYENYAFFDEVFDSKDTKICSYKRNSSNQHFHEVAREAVGNVSSEARKNQGFAVGSVSNFNSTVYVLSQCWKNLGKASCSSCLNAAASQLLSCSRATEGWALYAGCYMRYSTELFWNVDQETSSSSGKSNILWIVLGSSLGGFLLTIGIIVVWRKGHFRCNKKRGSLRDLYGPGLSAAVSQSNLSFRYEELKRATKNFSPANKLGQGSYGTVYKAALSDGKEVAVKRLFLNTRQWVDQFFNEVNLINQVRHKNLAKLLGCSVDGPESLLLYEYYHNRSLDLFIFGENRNKHLDWQLRFDIIRGLAEGLSYLHEESETRIIHRDIKASNVLLDDKFKPKITDFGLARSFSQDQTHLSTGIAGTLGYLAPEYIVHGHLTEKADVYSFGILIFEIVTGKRFSNPVGSQAGHSLLAKIWNCYKAGTLAQIIDESIYKENKKDEILHVVETGLLCAQANPRSRPTMTKVVELLRSSRSEEELVLTHPPFFEVSIESVV